MSQACQMVCMRMGKKDSVKLPVPKGKAVSQAFQDTIVGSTVNKNICFILSSYENCISLSHITKHNMHFPVIETRKLD